MINNLVKENERVDDLQNGYYIIQDPQKFCFGMDFCSASLVFPE